MKVPDEIIDLIRNSGNNFHAKVARWFANNGWHVVISPYYMDQTQSKAREIDLVAEKLWFLKDHFGGLTPDNIAVRLFIECKFVASDTVFWFAEKNQESALELVCKNQPFRRDNSYTSKHHYLSQGSRVAKLFATSNSKAAENEPFYKALNQSLNAMTSMRGQPVTTPQIRRSNRPKAVLEYPVVVCSSFDRIFSVDFFNDSEPESIQENFQLEVSYAYIDRNQNQRNDYFLLDFVAFDKLAEFGTAIGDDADSAKFLASF